MKSAAAVVAGFGLLAIVIAVVANDPTRTFPVLELQSNSWSIGIYAGASPLALNDRGADCNPVLRSDDVDDRPAWFVADPFLFVLEDTYHLFFEVMPSGVRQADIGHASSTDRGCHWTYNGIILDGAKHLAYPFVFEWQGEIYLLPDTQAAHLTLWRADPFPSTWKPHATFPKGDFKDPTLLRHDERWWLFSSPSNDVLELHSAATLTGPWTAHPKNPIVDGDATIARPGGRPFEHNGRLFRVAQDDGASYGRQVRAVEITELSETDYEERRGAPRNLAGASGVGWNSDGMHHFDAHRLGDGTWIAAVDGRTQRYRIVWKRRSEIWQ